MRCARYNTCYRNHLRRHGVEDLIVRLSEEAPQLKDESALLHRLREWAAEERLADYDIQCYNIRDKVTILGHTFNGLKDIQEHIELYGPVGFVRLKFEAPRYFGGSLLNTDICDFAMYAYRFPIDSDIQIHNIFVAGKQKMEMYVRPNPNLANCATWMDSGTEQGNQYLNFDDINVYIPNGRRIYRYWKCRPLLQVSDTDERFSHFTEDERLF